MAPAADSSHSEGLLAGGRTFRCAGCEFPITLLQGDEAPTCPRCGSERFERASIFSGETQGMPAPAREDAPAWLTEIRASLAGSGPHLAWDDGEEIQTLPIPEGFTHVGRSIQAEIHLSDPTVSRRHALIHRSGLEIIVLDDHSLNGVFVGGERVDWRPLGDGDEIELGRFRLHFVGGGRSRRWSSP
jgi:DNA-directed RNA polymerase subunit RPC12/RpoP